MDFGLAVGYQSDSFTLTSQPHGRSTLSTDLIHIIQSLHSSLEPRTVFANYGKILGQHLPIIGVQLQLANHHFIWGIGQGKGFKCFLPLNQQSSEIHYRLSDNLSPQQLSLLKQIEELLPQALENAMNFADMSKKAMFDALTSLGNRRYYQQMLESAIARFQRANEDISLLILDLDNFKSLNDRFGHQLGDTILSEFGALLTKTTRNADQAFRIGGDEFVVIVHGDSIAAEKLSQRIIMEINDSPLLQQFDAQSSIGIAQLTTKQTSKQLYEMADKALYSAKLSGKNNFKVA
ncbi:GGDEF domain-containing protein [Parashewanella spongiae]|uniref:diguanylate cyclase n=1 Tax=Parashewanella spongiae TaxID=342950 RepID=A0A3A6TSE9_9GAMM|nr:GGDEF domain-containing protein [Parashewanella spongiae]MCL1076979.1 GGDEF domain-containing protein [Parashewanella spongiae]RJY19084.1 GGDEF domain-containing protein [Parashewanella spongiae]